MTPCPVRVTVPGTPPPKRPLMAFSGVSRAYVVVAVTLAFWVGEGLAGHDETMAVVGVGAIPGAAVATRLAVETPVVTGSRRASQRAPSRAAADSVI
jgi:hypothetical protein